MIYMMEVRFSSFFSEYKSISLWFSKLCMASKTVWQPQLLVPPALLRVTCSALLGILHLPGPVWPMHFHHRCKLLIVSQ